MSEEISNIPVNQHYLEKVMDLAEEMDVQATEDIFDARGMKLVAKGAKISRNLQEKLILHKLKKPLEKTIEVDGGVNADAVVKEARRVAEEIMPVRCIFKAISGMGSSPFDILARLKFGGAMSMMLTIIERGGEAALAHSAIVSLVSICFAKKIGMNETDQKVAGLAGLLHDIGELYIDPEYLHSKRRLLPNEWRHVVAHPRIGQVLINGLENCPAAVGQAVLEHHERLNGIGYPRQVSGQQISQVGQVVAAAEMLAGVLMRKERPLERAEIAMKIIPGEHAHGLVSVLSTVLRDYVVQEGRQDIAVSSDDTKKLVRDLREQVTTVLQMGREHVSANQFRTPKSKELLLQMLARCHVIERAFSSTGLDLSPDQQAEILSDENTELLFEAGVSGREIQWRLRDIARTVELHASVLQPEEYAQFQPLIKMLDEGVDKK